MGLDFKITQYSTLNTKLMLLWTVQTQTQTAYVQIRRDVTFHFYDDMKQQAIRHLPTQSTQLTARRSRRRAPDKAF